MQENRKRARTVQEEASRERKFWKQNQLWSVLLAVVVLFGMMGRTGLSVAPGPAELLLTMEDGSTETIAYGSIVAAELLENADYGTAAEGKDSRAGKAAPGRTRIGAAIPSAPMLPVTGLSGLLRKTGAMW